MSCRIEESMASVDGEISASLVEVKTASAEIDKVVRDADARIVFLADALPPLRGDLALIKADEVPPSVVAAIACRLAGLFTVVAVFTPEVDGYVVIASQDDQHGVGYVFPGKSVLKPPYIL